MDKENISNTISNDEYKDVKEEFLNCIEELGIKGEKEIEELSQALDINWKDFIKRCTIVFFKKIDILFGGR